MPSNSFLAITHASVVLMTAYSQKPTASVMATDIASMKSRLVIVLLCP